VRGFAKTGGIEVTESRESLENLINDSLKLGRSFIENTGITKRTSLKKRFVLVALNDIVRKGESIKAMVDAGHVTGCDIVFRSMLEGLVDLLNVIAYADSYPHYMMYRSSGELRKNLLSVKRRPKDGYAKSITRSAPRELGKSVDDMLHELEASIKINRKNLTKQYFDGGKTKRDPGARVNTTAKRRFDLASMEDVYESMYRLCSGATHASVSSMLSGVGKAGDFDWPPDKEEASMALLDSTAGALITAIQRTARNIGKPLGSANRLKSRLTSIRAEY
jgi:hypothetical protein